MSSGGGGSNNDSEYEDIKVFFTTSEWKELTIEEKKSHRKSKDNYEAIRRCGWTTRPPFFMCRKLPSPERQQPPQQQDETSGEAAAFPSRVDHAEEQGRPPPLSPDQPREGANHGPRASDLKALGPSTPALSTVGLSSSGRSTHGLSTSGLSTSGLNTPGLSTPGLSTPELSTPGHSSPGLSTPGLSTPGLSSPLLSSPLLSSPWLRYPWLSSLALSTPGLGTPGLGTPGLNTPGVSSQLHDDAFLCAAPEPTTSAGPRHPKRKRAASRKTRKEAEPQNDVVLGAAPVARTPEPRKQRFKIIETSSNSKARVSESRKTHKGRHKAPELQDGASPSAAEPPPAGTAAQDGEDRGLQEDAAGEAPHRCATCGAAFRRAALLRAHMRTHATKKSGEHCGVSPASTRTGDRLFKCQTCGQPFSRSAHLRQHTRTHTGAAPAPRTSEARTPAPMNPMLKASAEASISEARIAAAPRFCKRAVSLETYKETEPQDDAFPSAAAPPPAVAAGARGEHAQDGEDRGQQDAAGGEAPHRCATCGAAFRRAALLRAHMRTHAADELDSEEHCGDSYAGNSDRRRHAITHKGAASETGTSEPGRITQTRISRTSRKTQKGPEVQDGDSLSAAEPPLDGAARTRGEHAQHGADRGQQDAAGEAPHRCATCGAAFRRAALLRAHMRTHAADKLDSGEHCGVSPASTLIGDRPFNCQTCGQRFTYSSNLRVHMRTHTGDRPFNCQTCGQRFSQSSHLRQHIRTHTGEKPYKCQTCGKRFAQVSTLSRHMRTHTGEKPDECQTCGKRFALVSSLRRHMRTHTGERPYKCHTCGEGFFISSTLREHMRAHTKEKQKEKL